jgi:hypothetical protein
MSKTLRQLHETLIAGQRLAMQGSYERRAPANAAVPFLLDARAGLREYVRVHENDAAAWRLLSQAEECLLAYGPALACLERAMSLSGKKDKKDLKRIALLRESEAKWTQLAITPEQLAALGRYLESRLDQCSCDHTLRHTEQWFHDEFAGSERRAIQGVRSRGGYCDCEVLANLVRR